jgi:phosphoenolpyruvate---glycerone phosphotransferase subunit DhaL
MLHHVAGRMVESEDVLGAADRAVGDGDHGVGMARGFEAVRAELVPGTAAELLRTTGRTLTASVGGASGVLFGTMFSGGAARVGEKFDADALRSFLLDGLAAVQKRGKAEPGDKTMVDALAPAARAVTEAGTQSLAELLGVAAEAAREGVEQTKGMVARTGKARSLGERSLGHEDPGALSVYVILRAMSEAVPGREE